MKSASLAPLARLVQRHAVLFGDFTLASGKKSPFYIDCRLVTLRSEGAALIGDAILDLLRDVDFDAVGGMTLGADPILAAVLTVAGRNERSLRGFIVRKEAKTHGAGKQIEGPIDKGDRVVIVEDVATSGGSALQAVDAVESMGARVVAVVAVLDRKAGAQEAFERRGIPFHSLLTIDDLDLTGASA